MLTGKLTLEKLIQDSQEFGGDDEHMVSRVFFSLEVDGKVYGGLYADIKQVVGSNFANTPLEVSRPARYRGPFNYEAFQSIVENYYRTLIGSSGSGIRIAGGGNVRMRGNTFISPFTTEIQISPDPGAW